MMSKIIMTSDELAARCVDVAELFNTIYMYAAYGFQVTDATIAGKAKQNLNGWYTAKNVAKLKAVANRHPPVWGFDCVNLIEGILWGWWGNEEKEKGGAIYASNGVPDTNADGMIGLCKMVTTDFSEIAVGEAVWMPGHIGVYVGQGLCVECTPKWADGVQFTACWNIGKRAGYNGRTWTKHGRLPWISYGEAEDIETPDYALGNRNLKRGCQGEDVRELQNALIKLGFSCGPDGADGDFGAATQKAVIAFQAAAGLTPDGVFGPKSLAALKEALARMDSAEEKEPTYTVTRRGISKAEMEAMVEKWPDCEVEEDE